MAVKFLRSAGLGQESGKREPARGRDGAGRLRGVQFDVARAPAVALAHECGGGPTDRVSRATAMRQTGAAVIKVAVTASRLSDALPLLDISRGGDAVVIAMGDAGVPSRLLASRFGSRWTYAGHAVAPGSVVCRLGCRLCSRARLANAVCNDRGWVGRRLV